MWKAKSHILLWWLPVLVGKVECPAVSVLCRGWCGCVASGSVFVECCISPFRTERWPDGFGLTWAIRAFLHMAQLIFVSPHCRHLWRGSKLKLIISCLWLRKSKILQGAIHFWKKPCEVSCPSSVTRWGGGWRAFMTWASLLGELDVRGRSSTVWWFWSNFLLQLKDNAFCNTVFKKVKSQNKM